LRRRVLLQGRNRHAFDHREVHLGRMCTIGHKLTLNASRSSDRICRRLLAPNLDRRQSIYSLVRAEKYRQAIGLLRQARGSSQVGA